MIKACSSTSLCLDEQQQEDAPAAAPAACTPNADAPRSPNLSGSRLARRWLAGIAARESLLSNILDEDESPPPQPAQPTPAPGAGGGVPQLAFIAAGHHHLSPDAGTSSRVFWA